MYSSKIFDIVKRNLLQGVAKSLAIATLCYNQLHIAKYIAL